LKCNHRFTTYERIELAPIVVLKQNGDRESFDRGKLLREVVRICERTAIAEPQLELLVSAVESELQQRINREVSSQDINDLVLQQLRALSEVAYIRYASVYCDFENIEEFLETLNRLKAEPESKEAMRSEAEFAAAQVRSNN
jgi:transcriptional repressor NrdR